VLEAVGFEGAAVLGNLIEFASAIASADAQASYINLANVNNRNYAHTCVKLTFFLHHTGCGIY